MVPAGSEPFGQSGRRKLDAGLAWRHRLLIGLLIAATFAGSIDTLRSAFVTTAKSPKKLVLAKFQDRLMAVTEPARPVSLQISEKSDSKPSISVAEVEAFSVDNIRPTDGFIIHHASSKQQRSAANLPLVSSPRIAAEPRTVPLPKRKPSNACPLRAKRLITEKAQTTTAKQKPVEQAQEEEPKPMAFGSIGYNYDPQR